MIVYQYLNDLGSSSCTKNLDLVQDSLSRSFRFGT